MANLPLLLCLLVPALLIAGDAGPLKNGALAVAEGGVTGWRGGDPGLAAESTDLPAGLASGVRLTVHAAAGNHGQLGQRLALTSPRQHLRVGAWLRGSSPGCAYVQAKLFAADGSELGRQTIGTSTTAWSRVEATVATGDAAAIEVLLRWIPEPRHDGAVVRFAGVTLAPAPPAVHVVLVGDSTVEDCPPEGARRGWGQMLGELLAPGVEVANRAVGGRSTSTFRAEGRWDPILAEHPDLVLMQFGHNDSHPAGRPESTDAATTYRDNLRRYLADARQAGIAVVLVTPPPRRTFAGDAICPELRPYAEAMRTVAAEAKVPCVDLYAAGSAELRRRGEAGSEPLFCARDDRSHFSAEGARLMARLVGEGLLAQQGAAARLVRDRAAWPAAAGAQP